jgi:hypothetical protein
MRGLFFLLPVYVPLEIPTKSIVVSEVMSITHSEASRSGFGAKRR